MKILKFSPDLVPLILSGAKTSTWRLWDDKDLATGDLLSLVAADTLDQFAMVEIVSVIEKPMGELTDEDRQGHESFESDEEMYDVYSHYYGRMVGAHTMVKIVRFEIVPWGLVDPD